MAKYITVNQFMAWKPCYKKKKIMSLIGKRKRLDVILLLKLDIPDIDKLWCLLHKEVIPEKELHLLACKFADHALKKERKAGREPAKASWDAIKAKKKWLAEKITDSDLLAAWSASWSVAKLSAERAASAAGMHDALYAAESAAWAAAWYAAEPAWQIKEVMKVIERLNNGCQL
jgi:hypothetical protein